MHRRCCSSSAGRAEVVEAMDGDRRTLRGAQQEEQLGQRTGQGEPWLRGVVCRAEAALAPARSCCCVLLLLHVPLRQLLHGGRRVPSVGHHRRAEASATHRGVLSLARSRTPCAVPPTPCHRTPALCGAALRSELRSRGSCTGKHGAQRTHTRRSARNTARGAEHIAHRAQTALISSTPSSDFGLERCASLIAAFLLVIRLIAHQTRFQGASPPLSPDLARSRSDPLRDSSSASADVAAAALLRLARSWTRSGVR